MPQIPNVIFMSLIINIILLVFVKKWYQRDDMENIKKLIVFCLSILYFFAFFHKLNHDFLDPEYSCGSELFGALFEYIPGLVIPDQIYRMVIYLTLVFEFSLPFILWFRKTRMLGLLLGFIMHLFFAGTHYDFTSFVFALYFLLLPAEFWRAISEGITSFKWQWIGSILLIITIFGWFNEVLTGYRIMLVLWFLFFIPIIIFVGIKIYSNRKRVPIVGDFRMEKLGAVSIVLGILIVFNGLNPYLGLKTEYSFAMFSNLRTEASNTNHLILGEEFKLFDFQDDLVYIHDSNLWELERKAKENIPITYFTFRAILLKNRNDSDFYLTYSYNDSEQTYKGGDSTDFLKSYPFEWLLKKWLNFRAIQLGDHVSCSH
jgi:hypothetical protein